MSSRLPPPSASVQVSVDDARWYLGLNLDERLALEQRAASPAPALTPEQAEVAAKRLKHWRGRSPFQADEWWARKLAHAGLDESTLLRLLGESAESLKARCPTRPVWAERVVRAFTEDGGATSEPPMGPFARIVMPLVSRTLARVRREARRLVEAHPASPFDADEVVRLMRASLVPQVEGLLDRVVVLEMHKARVRAPLEGATPRERFVRFVAELSRPERALEWLADHPVLARLLTQALDAWEETSLELLGRLVADFPELCARFSPDASPGRLMEVAGGAGDSHAGGRSVRILRFESGFRVVYKPRPMGVDGRFGELVEWLNARGAPQLRAVRVLEREHHGWAEFVPAKACDTRDEVARFYERQGAFLALLYALNGNDIHRENLIAQGEHPVLVDLESLCGADYGHSTPETYDSVAEYELDNSVMKVMLLPFFHEGLDRQFSDMSGIGGSQRQLSLYPSATWENWGTDEMRMVYRRHELPDATNRPVVAGEALSPFHFARELEDGFTRMYQLLVRVRDELLEEGSPLMRLRGTEVRTVLRASQFYGFVLRDSAHPDLLRDALERDAHQDRMWFGIQRSRFAEHSLRLLGAEQRDLWRADIPVFRNRFDSRDLLTSDGKALPGFFVRSGLETVRDRLGQLGDEDFQRQHWFLRASLTALATEAEPQTAHYPLPRNIVPVGREELLAAAIGAGEQLARMARRGPHGVSWLGLAWTQTQGWWLRPLEYDLYSGLPGVALFMGYLGSVTGREDFTQLARGAMDTLRRQLERRPRMVRFLGGFDGLAGLLYAWTHLATLWEDGALLKEALELLPQVEAMVGDDKDLDLLRGASGAIVPLLGLYRVSGDARALELARRAGDRLVAEAQRFGEGKAWLLSASPLRPLTGFSHGAAGPAWALTELYGATGDERYREVALQAVAFENGHYSEERMNWRDLRPDPSIEKSQYMASWCHGAVGVGLSRLRMARHLDEPRLREDARNAATTALHNSLRLSHSLCHGDLSALELFAEAARVLDAEHWGARLQQSANMVVASIQEHGFLGGVPLKVETPGLMDGISGIGHGLLRLAVPERVPSVLTLDAPPGFERAGPPARARGTALA
nr:class 2 lanthipeptide synthetase [Myxococcus fulvus]